MQMASQRLSRSFIHEEEADFGANSMIGIVALLAVVLMVMVLAYSTGLAG
jgi:hypothetical protein